MTVAKISPWLRRCAINVYRQATLVRCLYLQPRYTLRIEVVLSSTHGDQVSHLGSLRIVSRWLNGKDWLKSAFLWHRRSAMHRETWGLAILSQPRRRTMSPSILVGREIQELWWKPTSFFIGCRGKRVIYWLRQDSPTACKQSSTKWPRANTSYIAETGNCYLARAEIPLISNCDF